MKIWFYDRKFKKGNKLHSMLLVWRLTEAHQYLKVLGCPVSKKAV